MSSHTLSPLAFLVSLVAMVVYAYSYYYMTFTRMSLSMTEIQPKPLQPYGQLKFLTYQCLIMQLLSSILHVGAHFSRSLKQPRDMVFTILADPVGNTVVYTFWGVWHLVGREYIFPTELSRFYPDWLNHATHTIPVPINLILLYLVHHKYSSRGGVYNMFYNIFYCGILNFVKLRSGIYVYRYLETMNELELVCYFVASGMVSYMFYKSGEFLTSLIHGKATQRSQVKKTKQKQI